MPRYRVDVDMNQFMTNGGFNAPSSFQGGGKKGNRRRIRHEEDDLGDGLEPTGDEVDSSRDCEPGITSDPPEDSAQVRHAFDAWDAEEAEDQERKRQWRIFGPLGYLDPVTDWQGDG